MKSKNIFTPDKKDPTILYKIGMLVFTALSIIILYHTLSSNVLAQDELQVNRPNANFDVNTESLPNQNSFYGLAFRQENGNDLLELNFTNLTNSVVDINDNDEYISIIVTGVENAADYESTPFLANNITLEQNGETLSFKVEKKNLNRRYLIQQYDDQTIVIKLLSTSLEGKKITVDPGHGGIDPGASGPMGLLEKDVVLDISLRLRDLLEEAGAEVLMTRDIDQRAYPGDYREDLIKRVEFAEEFNSDMFISIHNNASTVSSVTGMETLYQSNTVNALQSKELALTVQSNLAVDLQTRDRGVVDRNLDVLRGGNFVSVLTEILFITNPEDEKMMRDANFADKAAQSIFNAIEEYYGN